MTNTIDLDKLEQVAAAASPGPWRWELNVKNKSVSLVGGKPTFDKTVMGFERWGMGRAAPNFNDAVASGEYNIMERVEKYGAAVPGREHHADWFKDVAHPDAQFIAQANPAVVLELVRRLRAADSENANLRQAVADNITSSTMLTNMGIVNGGMNITLEGGACQLLADAFCEQFRSSGATNFVEMGFTGPDNLQLLVTLQKVYGKTPAQLKREAEERVAQLEAEAVRREEYIEILHAERIGGAAQGASHD